MLNITAANIGSSTNSSNTSWSITGNEESLDTVSF